MKPSAVVIQVVLVLGDAHRHLVARGVNSRSRNGGSGSRPRKGGSGSRPRHGGSGSRPRHGGSRSRPRNGGSGSRSRPRISAPTLPSPIPDYVSARVKKLITAKDCGFALVDGVEGDVYFRTSSNNRIPGDNAVIGDGHIIWGKLVKTKSGKMQLHQIMSNEFMNLPEISSISQALHYKEVSSLARLDADATAAASKIDGNHRNFSKRLEYFLNKWGEFLALAGFA